MHSGTDPVHLEIVTMAVDFIYFVFILVIILIFIYRYYTVNARCEEVGQELTVK